jgi:hypothetical protein
MHVAFKAAAINDLLDAPKRLKDQVIMPLSFFGKESMEPSIIRWTPAAAMSFLATDYFSSIFLIGVG